MKESPKDAAAIKVFPPLIPIACLALGAILESWMPIDPGFALSRTARRLLGAAIILPALLCLGAWSVTLMRKSGQSENPYKPTTEVVECGPYRMTRNPMYLQMILICVGLAILDWNVWTLLLTPLCVLGFQRLVIEPEEAYLESKFGDGYRAYKQRVRRWI